MDTEDEFMSGMSESEADFDFQNGDSDEEIDMGSDNHRELLFRVEPFNEEWKNAISRLLQEIKPYVGRLDVVDASIRIHRYIRCVREPKFTSRERKILIRFRGMIFQSFKGFRTTCRLRPLDHKDYDITQEKGHKWTIQILREFTNILSNIIESWKTFKDGQIRYFYPEDPATPPKECSGRNKYLASIDKCIIKFGDLRRSLLQQTDVLENMTNGVIPPPRETNER